MRRTFVCLTLLCLSAFPWARAEAQYQPAPTQYTIVEVSPGQTQHIYRDGGKVLVDLVMPKSKEQPDGLHWRTIVDAPTTTNLTWDLLKPSVPCNSVGKGDWGDPFGLWSQMALDDSIAPKEAGQNTVERGSMLSGVTVRVWEGNANDVPALKGPHRPCGPPGHPTR